MYMTYFLSQSFWMYVRVNNTSFVTSFCIKCMYVIYQDPFYDDVIKLIDYS